MMQMRSGFAALQRIAFFSQGHDLKKPSRLSSNKLAQDAATRALG